VYRTTLTELDVARRRQLTPTRIALRDLKAHPRLEKRLDLHSSMTTVSGASLFVPVTSSGTLRMTAMRSSRLLT
jgi:hypothetical protein